MTQSSLQPDHTPTQSAGSAHQHEPKLLTSSQHVASPVADEEVSQQFEYWNAPNQHPARPCQWHATDELTTLSSQLGCRPESTHPSAHVIVQLVQVAMVSPQSPTPPFSGARGTAHEAPPSRQTQLPSPGAHCAMAPSAASQSSPPEMASAVRAYVFVHPAEHSDQLPTHATGAAQRHVSKFQSALQHTWSPG